MGNELTAANRKKFEGAVDAKLAEWTKALAPFKGAKIVTYHKDFVYLAARFNLDVVENLEPKPGIAPSPAHLAHVIEGTPRALAERVHTRHNLHLRAWKEIGEGAPATLAWFMEDYLGHLDHHLVQAGG